MKKWMYVFTLLSMTGWLTGCEDNNQWLPGDIPGKGQTALYSNKQGAPIGSNILTLTYSGQELIGKDILLSIKENEQATLTLKSILPGESETSLTNITLKPIDSGYSFDGKATGQTGTTFSYSGKVEQNKLNLNLTDINIPSNKLNEQNTWFPVQTGLVRATDPDIGPYMIGYYALRMETNHTELNSLTPLLGAIGGNLLTWFLGDITFKADGNIIADYGAPLPDTLAITDILMQTLNWNDREWLKSPQNLATYYTENDTIVYILPNIDMIIRQINQDNPGTRAENTNTPGLMELLSAYKQLNKWTTKGIKFTLRTNHIKPIKRNQLVYGGDYYLFLDKQEIEAFLPLLPLVKNLIGTDPSLSFVGELLDNITIGMKEAEKLEIGFMLDKNLTPHTEKSK